ncbi:MAG TPA: hypothetical protein VI277_08925 [Candidatus Limnocylindria bacterium]
MDRAVDHLFDGVTPGEAAALSRVDPGDRPLLRAASALHAALGSAPLASPRFEARLGARLAGLGAAPWILRHPGRLIVTGAVGSAVGVGVTAYAVWRSSRRPAVAHRLLQR